MEKLTKQMDDALNTKVAALNATDDETGDGKVDALDLKHQLDRVEAQLELQDQQNRSEEHTSELQSRFDLVCRLLLEKKKKKKKRKERR